MNIVYMGTPAFAVSPLVHLDQSHHHIQAVVTGQDKPAGRGRKLMPTPVKMEAERRNIPVLTPRTLKSRKLRESLAELHPDLFVVVAFRILPEELFTVPSMGSINVHGSLLPKYRGAAPINWALINGETETGLSSFFLKPDVDTGDVIYQQKIEIHDSDTFDSLYLRMSQMAGPFLLKTLELLEQGKATPVPQDDSRASRAPKLTSEDALIDWGFPARQVTNFVRGLSSKPGAYTLFRGRKVKILGCEPTDREISPDTRPGSILPVKKDLQVACAGSAVRITRIVPEGKKEMDGLSFINGFQPQPGEIFGQQRLEGNPQQ
jgi:methionyl-tRNA formyltransferase